jgi:hypothetical protein
MTNSEKILLYSHIDSSVNYLEFGSGESTIYAANVPTINSITSVESSEEFVINNLANNPIIANAMSNKRLKFHMVDIGETLNWGYPKNKSKMHLWPNYSLSVFHQKRDYDLVLVDGRFRVACTLNCILNLTDNCTILIHDFWNRPEYHIVLKFLKTEDKIDSLGVFKKVGVTNHDKIRSLIKRYQYLPGDKTITHKIKEKITKRLNRGP